MQSNTNLPTANEAWGFFGTMRRHADPDKAWSVAQPRVAAETECSPEAVRDFLDSRHGRHFADDVLNGLSAGHDLATAIEEAIELWMGWRIGRRTERETGIPHGLPHLVGFVTHFAIMAELPA